MKKRDLYNLYKKHIENTEEKAVVVNIKILLCHISNSAKQGSKIDNPKIYITSRAVKHLYDKKPAEEFNFIINNLRDLAETPDAIYANKNSKRGSICLLKEINGKSYFCSVEISKTINDLGEEIEKNHIVTAFRLRDIAYLKDYKLLWSWKDGNPSS